MGATKWALADATDARLDFAVIDQRCEDLDLSTGELAELLDTDPATIWRWKQGTEPRLGNLLSLQSVLGLSLDELAGRAAVISDAGVLRQLRKAAALRLGELRSQGNPTPKPAPGPSSPKPAPAPTTPSKPSKAV